MRKLLIGMLLSTSLFGQGLEGAFSNFFKYSTVYAGFNMASPMHQDDRYKLSMIDPDSNYHKLLDLASYGGTSWNSRNTAVRGLEKYIKDHPEILGEMIHFLEDPNYRVRWTAINILCKYGGEEHLEKMMEITTDDLLGGMQFSSGKNHLKTRMKKRNAFPGALKISKKKLSDIFDQMNQVRID